MGQEPGTPSESPTWMLGPKVLSHRPLLSQAISRQLAGEVEGLRLEPVTEWDADISRNGLTCVPQHGDRVAGSGTYQRACCAVQEAMPGFEYPSMYGFLASWPPQWDVQVPPAPPGG